MIYKQQLFHVKQSFSINKTEHYFYKNVSRETFHIKTRTKIIVEVEVIIKVIIEVLINITKKLKQK